MNPENLTSIRERLEKLYALSGENPFKQVYDLLKNLDGFVDFSSIPENLTDLPEFEQNEKLSGVYLNSQESFLLITNLALHWRQSSQKIQSIAHENIHTLELSNIENMLAINLVTDTAKRITIPLVHDDPVIHIESDTKYDASFVSLNQIVHYDSELKQSLPEICKWLEDGHPFDSELLQLDINPDILKNKVVVELLYSVLDKVKESSEQGKQLPSKAHPANLHLSGIENLIFTDSCPDYYESMTKEGDLSDLAVYFIDEKRYFILGVEGITKFENGNKETILYRSIDTVELDLSDSQINLWGNKTKLSSLPLLFVSDDITSAEKISKFLVLMSSKENIEDITSKGDLLRFLLNQYRRIPYCELLVEKLDQEIPSKLDMKETEMFDFFRVTAMIITWPFN